MPLSNTQREFVEKFLGVVPDKAASTDARDAEKLDPLSRWREGKERADQSIAALQQALKHQNIPALNRIADFGLNGLSDRNQTSLMKALFEFSNADPKSRKEEGQRLSEQVSAYRKMIETDEVLQLCENNPFGLSVDIRGPLLSALDHIEKAI